jgi:hypothetical protein
VKVTRDDAGTINIETDLETAQTLAELICFADWDRYPDLEVLFDALSGVDISADDTVDLDYDHLSMLYGIGPNEDTQVIDEEDDKDE